MKLYSPMKSKRDIGKIGEEKAAAFLERNGYTILERNFRNRFGEIDIVARDKGVICFIEVRTRRGSLKHSLAFESIGRLKQQRLSKLAVSFLKESHGWGKRARFDVISVSLSEDSDTESRQIILLKDAFPVTEKFR